MPAPSVRPMLATLGTLPADERGWAYEVKWDGVRAVCTVEGGAVRLVTRNANDVSARYPELARAPVRRAALVLDGEIVAFDADGRPSFERLQRRMGVSDPAVVERRARETPVAYVAFDLLWREGRSLLSAPYEERRGELAGLGLAGGPWQAPGHQVGEGAALLALARERGLEGIMAKRLGSRYAPGRRTGDWLKVKNTARQELVVGGWVPGAGRRSGRVGALLVGYHEQPGGPLRLAGKVGTGFTAAELERLESLLARLASPRSPFADRRGPRDARWVRPELVAEVEFTEWTADGRLRHPSYKGLRDDKSAAEVVREA